MFNFCLNVGVDLFYDVDLNVRCFLTNHSCGVLYLTFLIALHCNARFSKGTYFSSKQSEVENSFKIYKLAGGFKLNTAL